ncbi:MAG: hypothetical protein HOP02_15195 [Methylococcaceae bacterium]|nr:hypothetical protein [Methylococcaceae bacterium]
MQNRLWFLGTFIFLCLSCSDESKQLGIKSLSSHLKDPHSKPDYVVKTPDYLAQNWDHETRMTWWYTSQGSQILPYKWFLALEQSDNTQLFSTKTNLEAYRFISWPADPKWNPDGLPIGFVADTDRTGNRYFGVTCAACHTSKVAYKGKEVLVEGGPAHHDFDRFITDLTFALQQTHDNHDKFKRFVKNVLGFNATVAAIADLKQQLSKINVKLGQRVSVNHPPHANGYARLDAFGNIFNEVAVFALNEPSNANVANAPVSYPMLWDTPQHDVVQWNGSAVNAGIGAYARNVGEVVGVFGDLQLQAVKAGDKPEIKLSHHININNLNRLETILTTLWSPLWPAMLPLINQQQASLGKQLFAAHCVGCHENIKRDDPNRKIIAKLIPIDAVGTDPLAATNILTRKAKTGILEGQPNVPLAALIPDLPLFNATTFSVELVKYGVLGVLRDGLAQKTLLEGLPAFKAAATKNALKEHCDPVKVGAECLHPPRYKARPLNGIWTSAPYLHNGSVPNLWDLLQKPSQRVAKFNVGSWEMDPVKVGFNIHAEPASSEFNTLLPGNSNNGHDYGTALSVEEKWALLEYLKTL